MQQRNKARFLHTYLIPCITLLFLLVLYLYQTDSKDAIAQETLGTGKSGNGLDAITYYRNQEWHKLSSYCMKDVEITRDIYDYGRINKKVKYKNKWNEIVESAINFEYEIPTGQVLQMSLV